MDIDDVFEAVKRVELLAARGDHEAAHSTCDHLYRDVLLAIVNGALACEAIPFERWYA